jgi:hypothetical protein
MSEPKNTEKAATKFDDKLHKLIKRACRFRSRGPYRGTWVNL